MMTGTIDNEIEDVQKNEENEDDDQVNGNNFNYETKE
jgi:hypothetical protein